VNCFWCTAFGGSPRIYAGELRLSAAENDCSIFVAL
jgi:hypothetical protein